MHIHHINNTVALWTGHKTMKTQPSREARSIGSHSTSGQSYGGLKEICQRKKKWDMKGPRLECRTQRRGRGGGGVIKYCTGNIIFIIASVSRDMV